MTEQEYRDYVTRMEVIMNTALNDIREVVEEIEGDLGRGIEDAAGTNLLEVLDNKDWLIHRAARSLLDQVENSQKYIAVHHRLSEINPSGHSRNYERKR